MCSMKNNVTIYSSLIVNDIRKHLKITNKLIAKSPKFEELSYAMKYEIFSRLVSHTFYEMRIGEGLDVEFPINIEAYFKNFISGELDILSCYNEYISYNNGGVDIVSKPLEYGEHFIINDPSLLSVYADYFGLSVYEDFSGKKMLLHNWVREFDFAIVYDKVRYLKISFKDIRFKNLSLIKKCKLNGLWLYDTEFLNQSELEDVFQLIPKNLNLIYLVDGSQRCHELHSKFFHFVSEISWYRNVTRNIKDYTFLLNYTKVTSIRVYFDSIDNGFKSFIENVSLMTELKSLSIVADGGVAFHDLLFLSSLNRLEYLRLTNCSSLLDISPLYKMSNLKYLSLRMVGSFQYVRSQLDKLQEYLPELKLA